MTPSNTAPPGSSIRRKVFAGFGLVIVMLTLVTVVSYRTTRGFMDTAQWVSQAHQIMQIETSTRQIIMEMESDRRSYIITADPRFVEDIGPARAQIEKNLSRLREIFEHQPRQKSRLDQVSELISELFALQDREIEARRDKSFSAAASRLSKGRSEELASDIQKLLSVFEAEQNQQLRTRSQESSEIARANLISLFVGTLITFFALIFACSRILRDVAARRRAEQALASEHNLLSSIIDTMPDQVFVKDVKGRFILDNAAHRRYLGLTDDHVVEGSTTEDYYPREIARELLDEDRQVIETGMPVVNHELPVSRNGSGERWIETTKVPLRETDGTIVGLVGVSSDISERKLAEEKLKRFATQLERSNVELQNFASVASHDLQEPLRKIQAFGDRLRSKCSEQLGEIGLDYLNRMQTAAGRMQVLIQDLLKLSRVATRAQPFERCNLNTIFKDVISDLEVAIEKRRAKLEIPDLPTIDGDPVQLWQLFQNLVNNSLKFHRPGIDPVIKITSRIFTAVDHSIAGADAGDQVAEITVSDNGIGFEAKFAEQIFVVFQRLHSRDEYEGTGIGLAVCRKITDRHGGRIVAKGSEGAGATFIVTLPVKQSPLNTHE